MFPKWWEETTGRTVVFLTWWVTRRYTFLFLLTRRQTCLCLPMTQQEMSLHFVAIYSTALCNFLGNSQRNNDYPKSISILCDCLSGLLSLLSWSEWVAHKPHSPQGHPHHIQLLCVHVCVRVVKSDPCHRVMQVTTFPDSDRVPLWPLPLSPL